MIDFLKYFLRRIRFKHPIKLYWQEIDFAYIKTYSGFRGKNINYRKVNGLTQLGEKLISLTGEMHETTKEIAIIPKKDKRLKKLKSIFCKAKDSRLAHKCGPIYRDAIVFYSETDEIVGTLHICFSCGHLVDEKDTRYYASDRFYNKLKQFLMGLGHPINEER